MNSNDGLEAADISEEKRAAWPVDNDRDDPILSFGYIIDDLGISKGTFYRSVRSQLPVVHITARRRGVMRSAYLRYKARLPRA